MPGVHALAAVGSRVIYSGLVPMVRFGPGGSIKHVGRQTEAMTALERAATEERFDLMG